MSTTVRVFNSGAVSDVTPSGWSPVQGYPGIESVGPPPTWEGVTGLVLCQSGPTSARPLANGVGRFQGPIDGLTFKGLRYFDETLSVMIVWDGYYWRNPANGQLV